MGKSLAILAGTLLAEAALAHEPVFDPRDHREIAGKPTEILVLGSPHLSGLPAAFKPTHLSSLLDRLAAWKPDIITIESLSGPQCDMLRRYKAEFRDTAETYCWDTAPARKATGLDAVAATAEVDRLLGDWPAHPTAAQRRRLAAMFLAAGDRASALVQWLRLAPGERRPGDGIDGELATILEAMRTRRNENYLLGSVLAARLGLERVYPVDDHSADAGIVDAGKAYEEAITSVWKGAGARIAALDAENAKLGTPSATLALYRYHNRSQAVSDAFTYDFGAALKDTSREHHGRSYVGWWETRNLRMVANIRAVTIERPGARVLSIVGSSHKGYFEAYLGMMHDVRLADAEQILG